MNIRKLFNISFWKINNKEYKSLLSYDYSFNAVFRGEKMLSKDDLELREIRYLKLYRHAQCAKGTIWYKYFYHRLVRYSYETGIGLYENMNLPKGLIIGHAGTIVINGNATFRGNLFLTHGVTIGRDIRGKRKGTPKFGKNVCVRTNSTVVGNITIGDDVLIAPNTFVNFDVPSHSIVIGNPASIHHRDWATEGHLGRNL
jgi:serine O-acetyltransferase